MATKERKTNFITPSEHEVGRFYTSKDGGTPAPDPGEFPYTRGIHDTMYRGRLWTMRQYAGFGT
ncbi:MAG: hypothetical protein RL417_125, partial [Pseudomonadota bacterium]